MMRLPKDIASHCCGVGQTKANNSLANLLILSIMAGMFIALASAGANTVSSTIANPALAKLAAAAVFPCGLLMVLLAGGELFTGNALFLPMASMQQQVSIAMILRNWAVVYIGNFIGSFFIALLVYFSGQMNLFEGAVALQTIKTAAYKTSLSFMQALILGIMCNFLVCIAIWISLAAKTVSGKIIGLYMPIMLFILSGYEHSIANMYYIPAGLLAQSGTFHTAGAAIANIDQLTWSGFFFNNLLPVTIGNIIGGTLLVGVMYWFAYLKNNAKQS